MESLITTLLAHIIVFKDKKLLKIILGIVSVLILIGLIGVNMNETEIVCVMSVNIMKNLD